MKSLPVTKILSKPAVLDIEIPELGAIRLSVQVTDEIKEKYGDEIDIREWLYERFVDMIVKQKRVIQ